MGLDHMTARCGRIFVVLTGAGETKLRPRAALDGEPRAWNEADQGLFLLTDTSMFSVPAAGATSVIHRFSVDLSGLYPNSLLIGPDGCLYVGTLPHPRRRM